MDELLKDLGCRSVKHRDARTLTRHFQCVGRLRAAGLSRCAYRRSRNRYVCPLFGKPFRESLIDAYADAGVEFISLTDKRPKDKFGIAVGYADVSTNAQSLNRDFAVRYPGWTRRTFESLITAAYQYQLRDGWTVQLNIQYILRPGGGATDPLGPERGD